MIQRILNEKVEGDYFSECIWGIPFDIFYFNNQLAWIMRGGDKEYFPPVPQAMIFVSPHGAVHAAVALPTKYESVISKSELKLKYGLLTVTGGSGRDYALIKMDLHVDFSEDDFYHEVVKAKEKIADIFGFHLNPGTGFFRY